MPSPSRARSSWCSCCCCAPASSCCSCLGRCCLRPLLASRRHPWSPCLARPPRALRGLLPGAARRACQPCVWLFWGHTQDGLPRPLPLRWASPSACGPPASRPKGRSIQCTVSRRALLLLLLLRNCCVSLVQVGTRCPRLAPAARSATFARVRLRVCVVILLLLCCVLG